MAINVLSALRNRISAPTHDDTHPGYEGYDVDPSTLPPALAPAAAADATNVRRDNFVIVSMSICSAMARSRDHRR